MTFRFRYGVFRLLLSVLALGPAFSSVEVDADAVRVRMGWAFRATLPRAQVHAADDHRFVGGIGVHGWRGRWLVNGAATGLVRIDVEPPHRAWAVGIPVRLRSVRVSLEDPAGFLSALGAGATAA